MSVQMFGFKHSDLLTQTLMRPGVFNPGVEANTRPTLQVWGQKSDVKYGAAQGYGLRRERHQQSQLAKV